MAINILITGGAGFIGVNAAERFLRDGWNVAVLDNFSRKGTDIHDRYLQGLSKNLTIHRGDIRTDQELMGKLCDDADAVLHLAGQVAVTTSVADPRDDFENNAIGTFNVLEAVRFSAKKPILIYSSTNKVYGSLEHLSVLEGETRYTFGGGLRAVAEDQLLDFHSPYGCSKGAADQYVRDYARIYGLRTVVFRQSCIYGPHQMGIVDQGWVAWFMIAALFGRPVTLYGNGKQVRDLLWVEDLTDAYARAIAQIDRCSGQVYNMGGGPDNSPSLREFLTFLKTECGLDLQPKSAGERPGDQPLFVSDNGKFTADAGWMPTMNVHDGIKKLLAWLKEHQEELRQFYK